MPATEVPNARGSQTALADGRSLQHYWPASLILLKNKMGNESLIHADIFFFISTIALVVISIGLCIILYYVWGIAKNIRDISDKVAEESDEILEDVRKLRVSLRDEGVKWRHVLSLVRAFFVKKEKKARRVTDAFKHNE